MLRVWLKPRFGSWALRDLGYEDIQAFVNELGGWDQRDGRFVPARAKLGAERIRRCCFLLQTILTEAVLRGRLARSPYVKVRRPRSGTAAGRIPKTMRWLDAVQVEALARAIAPRYAAMIYVMAWGGLRFGEVAALRRGSCEFLEEGQLRVTEARKPGKGEVYGDTKGHQTRSVWLPLQRNGSGGPQGPAGPEDRAALQWRADGATCCLEGVCRPSGVAGRVRVLAGQVGYRVWPVGCGSVWLWPVE